MIPPTLEQVREYIREKKLYTVDAEEFLLANEAGEWRNNKGQPYRYWRKVLITWHHNNLRWGRPANLCRICRQYGVHRGQDDTGQQYWLCEDHKPRAQKMLPDELTENIGKIDIKTIDINERRNTQRKALGL